MLAAMVVKRTTRVISEDEELKLDEELNSTPATASDIVFTRLATGEGAAPTGLS